MPPYLDTTGRTCCTRADGARAGGLLAAYDFDGRGEVATGTGGARRSRRGGGEKEEEEEE
jgi:hypothetical protein